jgi:RNA polymerase sigma-70 factor (ECF subfamily)
MFVHSRSSKNLSTDLEVFFKKHYKSLCIAANNIVNDHDAAQDVVQDVFLALLKQKGKIKINTSLKAYIFRATINTSLNYIKKVPPRVLWESEVLNTYHSTCAIGENSLEHLELEESINQAIHLLPPKCKAVFLLNRYQDMKYREVAEHLGISVKTVENQMGKALKMLRNHLKPHIVRKSSITS